MTNIPTTTLGLCMLLFIGLSGCTTTGLAPGDSAAHPDGGSEAGSAPVETTREFTKNELYRLLVAEFAAKRDDMPRAIREYISVASSSQDVAVAERAVRLAMNAGDEAGSLEAARIWSSISPKSSQANQVYGALLMRAGKLEEAITQLETIVTDNGPAAGFDTVSELLSRERDKKSAMEAMRRLTAPFEGNPHALYAFAKLAARAGELEQATELLESLLSIDPNHERGAVFYARVLQQTGNITAALETLERSLEKNQDSQAVRMTYARLLVDAKHYDEARQQFEVLTEQAPDNVDVRYALGLLLLQTNYPQEAKIHFEFLTDFPERRVTAYYYLGQIAETADDLEAARAAYSRVDRGEHFLNAHIRIAVILAKLGETEKARQHLDGIPRQDAEQDIRIYRAEAEILSRNDQLEDAMDVYDRALDEYAGQADLLYARAMLAEKLDRLDILERDLRAILSEEPDHAEALNALGFTLADRTDRYDEALVLLERALELKPDDFYVIDSMGWVLYRVGRLEEAIEYLRRAFSISEDPEVAAHLGEVLWVMGRKEAAREIWDTALQTTPDDEMLLEVIKRFSN